MKIGWHGVWVAGLLLGGCAAQTNGCAVNPVANLPLKFDDAGLANIPATVNGVNATMLIDTGSQKSELMQALAVKAQAYLLSGGGQLVYLGVAGSGSEQVTAVKSFSMGGMTGSQVQFWVIPQQRHDAAKAAPDPMSGIVGIDLLSSYDIDFDYPDKTAALYDMAGCDSIAFPWSGTTAVIPLKFGEDGSIYMPVTINGYQFTALLDSGASNSFMPQGLFKQSGLAASVRGPVAEVPSRGIDNAEITASIYNVNSMSIGGVPMPNPQLSVLPPPPADDPRGARDRYEAALAAHGSPNDLDLQYTGGNIMTLGADFLRTHRVYISRLTQQAYVPQ
jgi:predicted aspartyl protease